MGIKDANGDLTSGVLYQVKTALNLAYLNYQHGHIDELNETLSQWSKEPDTDVKRYPLVWLVHPFTLRRESSDVYGTLVNGRILIITNTDPNLKSSERLEQIFKPTIYPIYRQLMVELNNHPAIQMEYDGNRSHEVTDLYFWENMSEGLNDKVDCRLISGLSLAVNNNLNLC